MTSLTSSPIHILVVDDVEQNLTAAEALLLRPGIVVLKASSGAAALEMLLVHEVALALIDVQMPGMDGFELAELIRGSERTRTIPLIFLTAATREAAFSFRGYEAGAVDFLFKPVDGKALISKVHVFVELYQQKKLLSQQLAELKHALHLNEMFTAVLGHDLRTPLSVVMNGATLLPMMTDQPKVVATAARIEASARRMARMVNQLLDLARIRYGTMQLNVAQHDYAALCRAAAEEFEQAGKPSLIALSVSGDVGGEVDAGLFSQVVSNLLCNALSHGQPGAPVQLNLNGSAADNIAVTVRNLGVIPPAVLPFIFEPFHQGDDSRKSSQGLGLGLYTVSMFVKAHGGTVAVTSAEPQGTVFTIVLPRKVSL
ncbi:hybrid sensor histidine kinase/response regulator [Janthinobacterium agaricidamnosum]|uniref:histidine kinase n=1 Tax=Janthinobacterium agaricidamnosum NBRC 102515 = DSM 9628 TaxID=1349767 RepID=W0VA85_9BURK|nr:hybrid sensor histidine kinase/response regulator [Janthinobacterium agaricidamnosum]CDG84268.1 response regulator [Janthinobacterium agaricidamnosum NBRC 102515 = DSM 9628]